MIKGFKHTEETKRKISISCERYFKNHPEAKKNISRFRKGKPRKENTKNKISESLKGRKRPDISLIMSNENNHNWKGNKANSNALHIWLKKRYKISKQCEVCGSKKNLDLANINNHKYSRNIKDYMVLCRKCHVHKDRNSEKDKHLTGTTDGYKEHLKHGVFPKNLEKDG